MTDLSARFDAVAYEAHARRWSLEREIEDLTWVLDPDTATLRLSDGRAFGVQYIGTFSFQSRTWRWADTNPSAELPDAATALVREVRAALGPSEWFARDAFAIEDTVGSPDAETLATVVAAHRAGDVGFEVEHEDGQVFVAVQAGLPKPADTAAWFRDAFQSLMWTPGDHLGRIRGFLSGTPSIRCAGDTGTTMTLAFEGGETLTVTAAPTSDGGLEIEIRDGGPEEAADDGLPSNEDDELPFLTATLPETKDVEIQGDEAEAWAAIRVVERMCAELIQVDQAYFATDEIMADSDALFAFSEAGDARKAAVLAKYGVPKSVIAFGAGGYPSSYLVVFESCKVKRKKATVVGHWLGDEIRGFEMLYAFDLVRSDDGWQVQKRRRKNSRRDRRFASYAF